MIPFDKRSGKIWYNNELVEWQDAKCHVISHGLHYASLVFEGERVYDGEIFKLKEHTERLFYSAKRLDIKIPYSENEINEATKKLEDEGKKIFKFGFGQSPFKVPQDIVEELKNNAYQNKYLPMQGLSDLRQSVAKYTSRKKIMDIILKMS